MHETNTQEVRTGYPEENVRVIARACGARRVRDEYTATTAAHVPGGVWGDAGLRHKADKRNGYM